MISKALGVLVVCVLVLTPGASVFAQEVAELPLSLVEVSAGYAYMRDTTVEENFPAGWYFSAGTSLNRWFGVAGEITGAHKTFEEELGFKIKTNLYTFMGGPRVFVKRGRIVPFAQVLAGAAHVRVKPPTTVVGFTDLADTQTEFAIQPGGGLTVLLTQNVAVRGAVDYRRILNILNRIFEDNSEVRAAVGVVFGWGAR
jgi:opacity protein-like surface antigen